MSVDAEQQFQDVKKAFQQWRKTKKSQSQPIPAWLWEKAFDLVRTGAFSKATIASGIRVSRGRFYKYCEIAGADYPSDQKPFRPRTILKIKPKSDTTLTSSPSDDKALDLSHHVCLSDTCQASQIQKNPLPQPHQIGTEDLPKSPASEGQATLSEATVQTKSAPTSTPIEAASSPITPTSNPKVDTKHPPKIETCQVEADQDPQSSAMPFAVTSLSSLAMGSSWQIRLQKADGSCLQIQTRNLESDALNGLVQTFMEV